jgi:hypothetical protein
VAFVVANAGSRRLCWIDFTSPSRQVNTSMDSLPVHKPVISPDGSMVAYGSQSIGRTVPSVMTVQSVTQDDAPRRVRSMGSGSAYLPRWWVDPQTADTFLIYADGAPINERPGWKEYNTLRQRFSSFSFSGNEELVTDEGSFHGGLSWDGQFLATGYTAAYVYDVFLHHLIPYFTPPRNGLSESIQTCNVSINPGKRNPDEILLLDFGAAQQSGVVGRPYGMHEVLFRCHSSLLPDDHVVQWYVVPDGYDRWNYVEYANHPRYAAAVGMPELDGEDNALYLIDLQDSSYLKVVSGPGVVEPWLWIDPAEVSEEPDPYPDFARYDVPARGVGQMLLARKLRLFWKRRHEVECMVLGSSPAYYGIDPAAMTSLETINMATLASDILTSNRLALNYGFNHASKLKAIVVSFEHGFFDYDLYPYDPWLTGLYDSRGYVLDRTNNFWTDGIPAEIDEKIAAFDSATAWRETAPNGYLPNPPAAVAWGPTTLDGDDFAFSDSLVQDNVGFITSLADSCAARGIHFVLLTFPQNPAYRDTELIGRYGPSRETYRRMAETMQTLDSTNTFFHFYDANAYGEHDYSAQEALDPNHLAHPGALKLTARVDSLLQHHLKK